MTIRTMPALSAATPASRRTSRSFADPALLIAIGLYIAVAIAEAVIIARALPSLPDTSLPDTSLPDTSLPDTSLPDTSLPDIGSYYVVVP